MNTDDTCSLPTHSRRLRILRLSSPLLVALLSLDGSKRIKITGMPADAKIVGMSQDQFFLTDQYALKIESETFEKVPHGVGIPEMVLECSEIREQGIPAVTRTEYMVKVNNLPSVMLSSQYDARLVENLLRSTVVMAFEAGQQSRTHDTVPSAAVSSRRGPEFL
jgi:hypothetical protein